MINNLNYLTIGGLLVFAIFYFISYFIIKSKENEIYINYSLFTFFTGFLIFYQINPILTNYPIIVGLIASGCAFSSCNFFAIIFNFPKKIQRFFNLYIAVLITIILVIMLFPFFITWVIRNTFSDKNLGLLES